MLSVHAIRRAAHEARKNEAKAVLKSERNQWQRIAEEWEALLKDRLSKKWRDSHNTQTGDDPR